MRTGRAELLPGLAGLWQLGVSRGVQRVCSVGHTTPSIMWPAPQSRPAARLGIHGPSAFLPISAPSQNKDGSVVPTSPPGPSGPHSQCVPESFLIPGECISSDSRSPGREDGLGLGLLQTLQSPLLRLKGREGLTLGALGLASLPLLQPYVLCPSTCLPDPFALSRMCCASLFFYLFVLASLSCLEGIS